MSQSTPPQRLEKYPLLEELLSFQGESLRAFYTNQEVAKFFEVSVRSIQEWISKDV